MVEILVSVKDFENFKLGKEVERHWDPDWSNVVGIQLPMEYVCFPSEDKVKLTSDYFNRSKR